MEVTWEVASELHLEGQVGMSRREGGGRSLRGVNAPGNIRKQDCWFGCSRGQQEEESGKVGWNWKGTEPRVKMLYELSRETRSHSRILSRRGT